MKVKVGDTVSRRHADRCRSKAAAAPLRAAAPLPAAQRRQRRQNRAVRCAARKPRRAAADAAVRRPRKRRAIAAPATAGAHAAHASPSVRKFARELGVDLSRVTGTRTEGPHHARRRTAFVKGVMTRQRRRAAAAAGAGGGGGELNLLPWPKVDFAKFGPVEPQAAVAHQEDLGREPARNWVMIPHVTQLRRSRHHRARSVARRAEQGKREGRHQGHDARVPDQGGRRGAEEVPDFNASASTATTSSQAVLQRRLRRRHAERPGRAGHQRCRQEGRARTSRRKWRELSKQARDGKLSPADMQGGCFSISSLGGIGGTRFTPIINAPEVAILGVSRSAMKPVWDGKQFVPRLMLPLSLSYDHRVIDGAEAARFNAYLAAMLADFRRVIL